MIARDPLRDRDHSANLGVAAPRISGPPIEPGLVSVVVPCYNYGRFLESSVRSATSRQFDRAVEVVIVDDCSTDETEAIGRRLAATVPRVVYMRNAINIGHIATYNVGLSAAKGEFVTLVSADDFVAPGALARAASVLEQDPRLAFVYGIAVDLDSTGTELDRLGWAKENAAFGVSVMAGREWAERVCRQASNPIASPEVVVRSQAQRAVGGYRPQLPHSGDLEMWLRLTTVGSVARIEGPVQAVRRQHLSNMSRGHRGIEDLMQVRDALLYFHDYTNLIGESPLRRESIDKALAAKAVWMARSQLSAGTLTEHEALALLDFALSISPGAQEEWRFRLLKGRTERRLMPWAIVASWDFASKAKARVKAGVRVKSSRESLELRQKGAASAVVAGMEATVLRSASRT